MLVALAVATYLRPHDIERCLTALCREAEGASRVRPDLNVDIIVVDNDANASAAAVVSGFADRRVHYVVEPRPGISAARNRALTEAGTADVLVFVDDDEEPVEGWLLMMLDTMDRSGAQAVAGRVVTDMTDVVDPWLLEGGFFSRRTIPTGTPISVAATNNLLLDLHTVRRLGLDFADRYGLTGGGDTHFTRRLTAAGARMVWCDEAVVIDHLPADRMTRSWVMARARRMGNTEVLVDIDIATSRRRELVSRARGLVRGSIRVATGLGRRAWGRTRRSVRIEAAGARTMQRGRGMLAGAVGRRDVEYAR